MYYLKKNESCESESQVVMWVKCVLVLKDNGTGEKKAGESCKFLP